MHLRIEIGVLQFSDYIELSQTQQQKLVDQRRLCEQHKEPNEIRTGI